MRNARPARDDAEIEPDRAPDAGLSAVKEAEAARDAAQARAIDMLGQWLGLSELDRRAFAALSHELTTASDLVERSTLELSERFQALAGIAQIQTERVQTIITAAQSIQVDGESVPIDAAMQSVELILRKVIATILSVSKHAMRMVYALDEITRDVDAAEQCASQIEAINSQTRYLALNAAIEANRSGGAGTAFGVIAHEMKTLSLSTAETSAQVRQRISAVATGVRAGHAVLKEIATLDMSEHIMAKQRLDALIAGVIGQNQSFNLILGDAASASKDISGTIGQLIMGIQFQDRNKQHTAHVVGALEVLGEATEGLQEATSAAYPGSFQLGAVDEAWLARLVANNTLESVKQRLLTRLVNGDALDGGAQAVSEAEPDVAEDDIELF